MSDRPSLVKPGLTALVGSGALTGGIVVERAREALGIDPSRCEPEENVNVVVVLARRPASLSWRDASSDSIQRLVPGEVIIAPAGLCLAHRWDAEVELLLVALPQQTLSVMAPHAPARLRPRMGVRDELLGQLLRNLLFQFEQQKPHDELYIDALIHALSAHLLVRHGERLATGDLAPGEPVPQPGWRAMGRVVEHIEDNVASRISVGELAAIVGVSPTHLTRVFRRELGASPHRYLLLRRLERAEALIRTTELPLARIATAAGFADQSHLSRVMRVERGATPGQLRRLASERATPA